MRKTTRKKLIIAILYLSGVVTQWNFGLNTVKYNYGKVAKEWHRPIMKTTYGDLATITAMSLTSWAGVVGTGLYRLTSLDFWDTPITTSK